MNEPINETTINNNAIQVSLKEISDTFYTIIKKLYSNFYSAGDTLFKFVDYMNYPIHFHNFFNNLFVYHSEDFTML